MSGAHSRSINGMRRNTMRSPARVTRAITNKGENRHVQRQQCQRPSGGPASLAGWRRRTSDPPQTTKRGTGVDHQGSSHLRPRSAPIYPMVFSSIASQFFHAIFSISSSP